MASFYIYDVERESFWACNHKGFTDNLDYATRYSKNQTVEILKSENAAVHGVVPVNATSPSAKPSDLENKLHFRAYAFAIRVQLKARGVEYGAEKQTMIKDAFKSRISVQAFVDKAMAVDRSLNDAVDEINSLIFAGGGM